MDKEIVKTETTKIVEVPVPVIVPVAAPESVEVKEIIITPEKSGE